MKNQLKNRIYNIKININNNIDELNVSGHYLVSELRQMILDKYLLSPMNYSIFYKNKKFSINDFNKISNVFLGDLNPFIFIINNKTISPESPENNNLLKLQSNLAERRVMDLLSKFFAYKSLPYDASIKRILNGKYKIKFSKPLLAKEFMQFYNISNKKKYRLSEDSPIKSKIKLPKIHHSFKYNSISSDNIVERNDREYLLKKVIKNNHKDSFLTEKSVSSGINIYHNSVRNISLKNKKGIDYQGVYYLPFLNPDEKYYREKLLDKKNWIDKKGFMVSVGNYKMGGDNFISNYVGATPSMSPLAYNFREINKNKWIDKKGFSL